MDASEVELVRESFNAVLADGGDVVASLIDMGWHELVMAEPRVAVVELFAAQGRSPQTSAALDLVIAVALGVDLDGRALVHPSLSQWSTPPGRVMGGLVRVDGLVLGELARTTSLLVPTVDGDGRLGVATVHPSSATRTVVADFPLADVELVVIAEGDAWCRVTRAARRALAHELSGLGWAILDRAAQYVTDRQQFGRPLATFQTTRHRLTDVFVALSAADAAIDATWLHDDDLLLDAAKALAADAAQRSAADCLQVSGAIAFTEEYGLGQQTRRIQFLDALYGSARQLRDRIGADLVAANVCRVPCPSLIPRLDQITRCPYRKQREIS